MKQPEDMKTIELPIEEKRRRGRPAKADALNQAERAKRYREKRKAEGIKRDVTEKPLPRGAFDWRARSWELEEAYKELSAAKTFEFSEFIRIEQENEQLKRQVKLAENERNTAFKAYEELEKRVKLNAELRKVYK